MPVSLASVLVPACSLWPELRRPPHRVPAGPPLGTAMIAATTICTLVRTDPWASAEKPGRTAGCPGPDRRWVDGTADLAPFLPVRSARHFAPSAPDTSSGPGTLSPAGAGAPRRGRPLVSAQVGERGESTGSLVCHASCRTLRFHSGALPGCGYVRAQSAPIRRARARPGDQSALAAVPPGRPQLR